MRQLFAALLVSIAVLSGLAIQAPAQAARDAVAGGSQAQANLGNSGEIELHFGGQFVQWTFDATFVADVFANVTIVWVFRTDTRAWISYVPLLGTVNFRMRPGDALWIVSPFGQTIRIDDGEVSTGPAPPAPPPAPPPDPAPTGPTVIGSITGIVFHPSLTTVCNNTLVLGPEVGLLPTDAGLCTSAIFNVPVGTPVQVRWTRDAVTLCNDSGEILQTNVSGVTHFFCWFSPILSGTYQVTFTSSGTTIGSAAAFIPLATATTSPVAPPSNSTFFNLLGASVVADDGTFLGIIDSNRFASDSICNRFGTHGSRFSSESIFNSFSQYGSQFSSLSAFNDFAFNPPFIVSPFGVVLGRLTTNDFVLGAVNPFALVVFLECTAVLD